MDIKTASALHRLRLVSVLEAVSFLVLLACSVLKRTTEFDAVPVMGPVHGVLVVLFVALLAVAWYRTRWGWKRPALLFVLSLLPAGGFFADRSLRGETQAAVAAAHAGAGDAAGVKDAARA
ncbi:DUF3817 domain-containing protein [Streptomyces polyrhachis]|uniref:DUF3817 domain-containing protein n=1 Tax=Streptomyces polyrhachis TaxID=1282885 RepID=A0ABW2GJH5_9ACTN